MWFDLSYLKPYLSTNSLALFWLQINIQLSRILTQKKKGLKPNFVFDRKSGLSSKHILSTVLNLDVDPNLSSKT